MKKARIPALESLANRKKKNVVIFDNCQFTIQGLTLLCERHAQWRMCGTAYSFSQLRKLLLARGKIDMVLCGIGNQTGDFSQLLNLPDYPIGSCILLTDKSSSVLRKTFLTAGFDAVLSKQTSLHTLDHLLSFAMHYPRGKTVAKTVKLYQPQEREVLSALLNGQTPAAIAQKLGISYRTVSRYKQSGLKRAGLRSLNEILVCQKNYFSG